MIKKKIFILYLIIASILIGGIIGSILSQYFPILHKTSWVTPFDNFHLKILPYYIIFSSLFFGISIPFLFFVIILINKNLYLKKALNFLKKEDKKNIANAIAEAEKNTSGEIRVHISGKKDIDDCLKEGKEWFYKLKMFKTRDRNGVLIFIAPNAKKFSIYGDEQTNSKIAHNFWINTKNEIEKSFKNEQYVDGIIKAINATGEVLKKFFPIKKDDKNELSDDITVS